MNSMLTAADRRANHQKWTIGLTCWLAVALAGSAVYGQADAARPAAKPTASPAAEPVATPAAKPATEPAAEPEAAAAPRKPAVADVKPPVRRNYRKLPPDETQKKNKSAIGKILMAERFEPGQQELLDTYYKTYLFPHWTDPDNFASITAEASRAGKQEVRMRAELRKDLVNDFRRAKSKMVHDHLVALALGSLTELAKGNDYYPVTRYNAMLMIGELNAVETMRAADPPTPLAAALPVMLEAITDPQQIDAVRVAALRGMGRHAAVGIADPQVRDKVIPAMIQVATTRSSPGRSSEGQAWMRLLAIEVLGNLHAVGPDGSVVKSLVAVIGESDGRPLVRCIAAKALGQLDYASSPPALNPLQIAVVLNELFLQVCTDALTRRQDEPVPFRRRELKEQVYCLITALEGSGEQRKGLQGLATTDAQKAYISGMIEQLRQAAEVLDDKNLEDTALEQRLTQLVAKLRQPAAAPAAKPAAAGTR